MKKAFLCLSLILSLYLAGCFGKKVTLEYKATPAEPIKYNIVIDNKANTEGDVPQMVKAQLEQFNMTMDMVISQKTTDTGKDNILNNELSIESGKMKSKMGEMAFPESAKKQKINIKIKKNGEMVENNAQLQGISSTSIFPDHPIGAGEKWNAKIKLPSMIKKEPVELECVYTLEKFETSNNQDCAVINVNIPEKTFQEKDGTMKMSIEGKIYFGYEKGQLVKNTLTSKTILEEKGSKGQVIMSQNITTEMK